MKTTTRTQLKYITKELKDELVGDLDIFDAGTIALYTSFASVLLALSLYAFCVYCI